MIESAAVLFRERGVASTSFADVLEHSGAPRGSLYHHFPGGKTQLAEESTRYAGEFILAGIVAALTEHDPARAIAAFQAHWINVLRRSNFAAGCVIVAATLEGEREPTVRDAAGLAFTEWERVLEDALHDAGIPLRRAASIATLAIASIEGAIILARAQRSTRPLERVNFELERLLTEALPEPVR